MKNKLFSVVLIAPLFLLLEPAPQMPAEKFWCSPTTTGSWTITYSQVDPAPCGTITITAQYNGGGCPAPGDITITKMLNSNVTASPNPVVGSIQDGVTNFTVGYMTISQSTATNQNFRLIATVSGGHTITNSVENTWVESCL